MIAALLPVKKFTRSKQRLAGFLSPAERAELARTMFEDVWTTLLELQGRGLDRLLVASAEPYVIAACRTKGITCLEERKQLSHTASVREATRWSMGLGVTSLLSVPIDTPAVSQEEILALLQLRHSFPVVVAPSADGLGTNALLRTPPDAIEPRFGPDSCRLHVEEAHQKNLPARILALRGFSADIDTPEDMQNFARMERSCRTHELVCELLAVNRGAIACS